MKTIFKKTHNVKSKRKMSDDKVFWEQHGVVLTSPEGYQRIILNTLPVATGSALELYLFPADKKKA
jgi:hypothetical protein